MPNRTSRRKKNDIPQIDIDASERELIGSIILDPKVGQANEVATLQPSDFLDPAHQTLFGALRKMIDSGTPIDTNTLTQELKRAKQFDAIGGTSYLAKLINGVCTAAHYLYHVEQIQNESKRRRAATLISTFAERLNQAENPDDVLTSARDELSRLAVGRKTNGNQPVMKCMADVAPREVDWLWYGRIPRGRLTLLNGHPGCGKSFLTMDMAARVSTGTDWPDGSPCSRGSVLLLTAEDDAADTIRPRLDALGADVKRIHCLTATTITGDDGKEREITFTLNDADLLETAIRSIPDACLIVIDPIGSYLGARTDSHRDNEVRGVLAPVAALAERHRVAVVIVCHTRKATAGRADDLILGSRGFVGLARAVWHLSPDPNNADRRLFLTGKTNISAPTMGLAFTICGTPARIEWEETPVDMSADDALNIDHGPKDGTNHRATALGKAVTWLRVALADGPRPGKAVEGDAVMAGISPKTLERARSQLGVVCAPAGFGQAWLWSLPQCLPESAIAPQSPPNSDKLANIEQNAGLSDGNTREKPRVRQDSESLANTDTDGAHLAETDGPSAAM